MDAQRLAYFQELANESQTSAVEGALAAWWIGRHFEEYDGFDFQKHVGAGQDAGEGVSAAMARMWYHATRKRADIVAYTAEGATIIELKDHIDGAAVRQAAGYRELWKVAPAVPPVVAVIVAGRTADPGIPDYAAQQNIGVEIAIEMKLL